jgi:hypothetical protein
MSVGAGIVRAVDEYTFEADLWRWEARSEETGGWVFVTMPVDQADDLRAEAGPPRGFGSVRVEARIGATTWRTSVFPSKETGTFVLPVKKEVRDAEGLEAGRACTVTVRVSE